MGYLELTSKQIFSSPRAGLRMSLKQAPAFFASAAAFFWGRTFGRQREPPTAREGDAAHSGKVPAASGYDSPIGLGNQRFRFCLYFNETLAHLHGNEHQQNEGDGWAGIT